jgi:OOP family OmpA-OmpF porin
MRAPVVGLLAAVALGAAAGAQTDLETQGGPDRQAGAGAPAEPRGLVVPGAQTDPGAPEGARETAHVVRDYDSYDLPVGPFDVHRRDVRKVEGAVAWSAHRLDDPVASVAGVMQGYRERLEGLGFETLLDCAGEECGGFDFRFGAEVLPPPGMLLDVRDFAQLSAARDEPEAYVSVLASRVLDSIYVQTVSVTPAAEPAEAATEIEDAPTVETAPETVIQPRDARGLRERLTREGHVPIRGLEFEVAGTRLSDGSAEALDMLASLLTREKGLSVIIVGHSDNQGGLDVNIDISRQRAEAVMAALIERGVPAAQLEARGVGFLAPLASNATEEGRARNRRVELVVR